MKNYKTETTDGIELFNQNALREGKKYKSSEIPNGNKI